MQASATDRIEKQIELSAPISRVWRAITDYKEFGLWFQVDLETPFVVGEASRGRVTHPGCERMTMEVIVEAIEPERLFSYRWHPCCISDSEEAAQEPSTLVEFMLEEAGENTRLTIIESGFDAISDARRDESFRRNEGGWTQQVKNIEEYVSKNP